MLISLSLKINLYVFSLYSRLNISSGVDLSSRPLNSLSSIGCSVNRSSGNGLSGLLSLWSLVKLNSFTVINNFSVINWLSIIFLSRNSNLSSLVMVLGNNSSGNRLVINNSSITSVYIYYLLNGFECRLYISFSNSNLSRNIDSYTLRLVLVINNWISIDSLGIYRSLDNFSSLYWSLNNSLSDDRLLNNGFSYNRLRNNFSSYNWSRFNSLSLSDDWLTEVSGAHIRLVIVSLGGFSGLYVSSKGSFLSGSSVSNGGHSLSVTRKLSIS